MGKHFTFVIITEKTSRVKKIRLPLNLLFFIIILILALTGITIFVFQDYFSGSRQILDIDAIREEYQTKQKKIDEYDKYLAKMTLNFDRLDQIKKKMRDLTSLEISKNDRAIEEKEKTLIKKYYSEKDQSVLSVIEDFEMKKKEELNVTSFQSGWVQFIEKPDQLKLNTPSDLPAPGLILSAFGFETDPFSSKAFLLRGITVGTAEKTVLKSPSAAFVAAIKEDELLGNVITLIHNGTYRSKIGLLSEVKVKVGDVLTKGQDIGTVSSGGIFGVPHYYYEVSMNGIPLNPVAFQTTSPEIQLFRQ